MKFKVDVEHLAKITFWFDYVLLFPDEVHIVFLNHSATTTIPSEIILIDDFKSI